MLKPLAKKKAMVLPSPQSYLEEYAQHTTSSTLHTVLQHNGAALRIQLRYRKYQEKVRMLLKKSEKAIDEQQQQDNAVTTAKAALRERSVTGSSMALAVAYNARKDNSSSDATTEAQYPLVRKPKMPSYASEMRSSGGLSDAAVKWSPTEWQPMPDRNDRALHAIASSSLDETEQNDDNKTDKKVHNVTAVTKDDALEKLPAVESAAEVVQEDERQHAVATRDHGFVDIMHHSWLLSSMEERCAEAAASVGAGNRAGQSAMKVSDFRHTVLDVVFITRSGVGHNFHGRAPSSVKTHCQNLVSRVQQQQDSLSAEDMRRVSRIFSGLQSDMFMPAVRTLGWILTKTWRMLFNGVHVDVASLHHVLQTLERAMQQEGDDVSVVFAPTHKTHLDYLIISYLCFAYGLPLPRIAAGNNLDLPLLGPFLRANGSFFIRRSFRDDQLYKQVLASYVHELMSDGNPIEVFVEGGRSRHGRVCKPRLGFLSMFHDYTKLDSESKKQKKVLLVPISLDYDKVYEVEEYANQLLGKPKQKESIAGFFKSVWDIFFLRCGHAYVRFGEPLALTQDSSLDDTARKLAVHMQTTGTVTSTALVAALLMWKRSYQTQEMLASRVSWLVHELEARAAHLTHVHDDAIAAHALSILNVDVSPQGVLMPQLKFPTRALEIGFYRNHVLHVFLPEMAIAGAIDALTRATATCSTTGSSNVCILARADVEGKALMMWNFLRHICRHDAIDIAAQLNQFVARVASACRLEGEKDGYVVVDLQRWRASKLVSFVLSLHWPFVDSLWLCAQGLWSLGAAFDDGVDADNSERAVVRRVQLLVRALFLQRQLVHAEALCSESIKQSFDFLVERGFIRYATSSNGRVIELVQREQEPSDELVNALVDEVNGWRKPATCLWKPHAMTTTPRWTQADAIAAMTASGEEGRKGVYDAWMAPTAHRSV
ncbi:Glycerol-3-phosphate acyltransferase, partial [Globisporangium splendens]